MTNDQAVARPRRRPSRDGKIDRTDTQWYKDAIIYQLHIKAFQDSNNDGMGDFAGLMQRLDYVESLGVTAIWILPFYPSPLRDDGYDIADYRAINPSYGDMRDFKEFVAEAHRRGIRVITELVINHTSDQHPWFQKARLAKKGSAARDFYVWSDTDEKYEETRIIFLDTEKSNWTWDPVAQQFFWHRFYSHQPDLNFDNPRVLEEVLRVMNFWLEMGVDGLRLDAIPYLKERDGTNNENLPETHEVLKDIRTELDRRYSDRLLLAEANQWPEDTRPYFGDGDECHMAFHFPLMPRMYMAVAQEDRHPITDIMRQTPDIPEACQWAIFLRNHDELTLEMVTSEERDYLWSTYANDRRARINLGIRRRLAPLMENDRRKIELMNALLLSMPGTPVLYYGDELGMGDNYYLGDRDGVRTPMQWSADRNGGFSRANPQALYLPPVQDPIYGFQAVNVEAQQNDASSLLNWTRRMISVRKEHRAFGRGTINFLYPNNRKVLAYLREEGDEKILCVANLSRTAQAVTLDLSAFKGAVPIEMIGRAAFPPVGDLPYMLTLPAYGFFWFVLASEADSPRWHTQAPEPLPEFVTLTIPGGNLDRALEGRELQHLEKVALPEFLMRQRWFAAKSTGIKSVSVKPLATISPSQKLVVLDVTLNDDRQQQYFFPMSVLWGEENLGFGAPKLSYTLAKARYGARIGALIDAVQDEQFTVQALKAMKEGGERAIRGGVVRFTKTAAFDELDLDVPIRPLSVEQSNASIALDQSALLKIYRQAREGEQPEIEISRFLTEVAGFKNTPPFLAAAEYVPNEGEPTALAAVFGFVANQGDAWSALVDALDHHLDTFQITSENTGAEAEFPFPLDIASVLGQRTAEMHAALSTETDNPAFAREEITATDISAWVDDALSEARKAFATLENTKAGLPDAARANAEKLLSSSEQILSKLEKFRGLKPSGCKTRIHGDYHLGQVLVAQNDVMIIDFEGEPQRPLEERRAKASALRDVAGMIRSFDYAAFTAFDRARARSTEKEAALRELSLAWQASAEKDFIGAYSSVASSGCFLPEDESTRNGLLQLFLLQKAFYEVGYEAANRPAWLGIPVRGVLELIAEAKGLS
ncbi:maltose alpha-D-glucosyltransferase [Faunimonas pinastri]|nr:maltose alpha-D-glucosyltransferase [Faunimonas pinastri]